MARQNITPNPSLKMFEAYMDFSGGRNSETSNERLRDNEFPTLDNVDLSSRGSAKRRHGRRLLANQSGRGQGVFFFYRQGQEKPDIIMAINGALFVLENGATVTKPIQIMDGTTPFFFQNQRPIEAVQYGTDMFIATGTKFCELTYIDAPLWLPETQYNVGDRVKAGGRVYECIVAGTSGTIAPTHVDTTNLLTENQSSVETDLTGFASYRGATLTRETTVAWHGSASLKVTTPGAQVTEGVVLPSFDVAPGQAYTASVYVRGSGAVKLFLHERDSNDAIIGITTSEVMQLTDSWQRVSVTRVFGATGTKLRFYVLTEGTAAIEFWVDGLQVEQNSSATPWVIGGTTGTATDGTVTWKYVALEWVAKVVTPYTPTVMEAIYIGTNGLADNPDAYVADGQGTALEVIGIKPANRTGTVNQKTAMVAYINKPTEMGGIDYKWEYKKSVETTWLVGRDFMADTNGGKTWDFFPDTATKWDIRVTARATGTTTPTSQYALTSFQVNQVEDKRQNTSRPVNGIQRCNKIMLHWDRLILAGDDENPHQIYISDLNAPRYFPVSNTISYDTGKQEPITAMVRYRDMLVIFTKTTIQTLVGKSPEDYRRGLIHDGIGCIAPRSAAVVGNNIVFLSAEGIHILKPNPLTLEVLNVQRIDYPIKSEIVQDEDACSMVFDSQYWLCLPSQSVIFRLYYDNHMWVRDKSNKLSFAQMTHYGNEVYELSQDGKIYKQDSTIYNDDGEIYPMIVESKYLDLSASFNQKKLKRLYVLARHYDETVDLFVTVKADSALALTPEKGRVEIIDGWVEWIVTTEPNVHFYSGTLIGTWIMGKAPLGDIRISVQKAAIRGRCRRVKVIFEHKQDLPCEIFGFGLEFKEKKP